MLPLADVVSAVCGLQSEFDWLSIDLCRYSIMINLLLPHCIVYCQMIIKCHKIDMRFGGKKSEFDRHFEGRNLSGFYVGCQRGLS